MESRKRKKELNSLIMIKCLKILVLKFVLGLIISPQLALFSTSSTVIRRHVPSSSTTISSNLLSSTQKSNDNHMESTGLTNKYEVSLGSESGERKDQTLYIGHPQGVRAQSGPCILDTPVFRLSLNPPRLTVQEQAIICSHIIDKSGLLALKESSLGDTNKPMRIDQIKISHSRQLTLTAIRDQLCNRFDCSKITVMNLTNQRLEECELLGSFIGSQAQLEVLDLTNTYITNIDCIIPINPDTSDVSLLKLTTLILDNNSITYLNFDDILEWAPNLRYISLLNNSITDINCSESNRFRLVDQFEYIALANNSIKCFKDKLWLMKLLADSSNSQRFPGNDQIKCALPERLAEMTWTQRAAVTESRICDECDCQLRKLSLAVDCHNRGLTNLPQILPLHTKVLNLTSNRIESLAISGESKNWENVTYVHLENNLISSFRPLQASSRYMKQLVHLDLRRNKFREFPNLAIFEQFLNLEHVLLSNNPWQCDCESTFAFQEWLQRQFHKVGDKEEIMCGISGSEENGIRSYRINQRLSSKVIYKLDKSEFCPKDKPESHFWLDLSNILLSLAIVLTLIKVTLDYVYQHRTKRLPHFFKLNY